MEHKYNTLYCTCGVTNRTVQGLLHSPLWGVGAHRRDSPGMCYAKRSLMSWVRPRLPLFWYDTDFLDFFSKKMFWEFFLPESWICLNQAWALLGMTMTQDIRGPQLTCGVTNRTVEALEQSTLGGIGVNRTGGADYTVTRVTNCTGITGCLSKGVTC